MADEQQYGEMEQGDNPFGHVDQVDAPFDPSLIAVQTAPVDAEPDEAVEAETETPDEPDYKSLYQQTQEEAEKLRQRQAEWEAQQEAAAKQQFEAAQRAWNEEAQRVYAEAEQMPHREALAHIAQFQQRREASLWQYSSQLLSEKEAIKYEQQARKLVSEHGLPEDEVETLVRAATIAGKSDAMKAEANRLKARYSPRDQELQQLREEINRLKAAGTKEKLQRATRTGQGNRSVPPQVKPGTDEHLASLLPANWLT